jgi:hypothetical protein
MAAGTLSAAVPFTAETGLKPALGAPYQFAQRIRVPDDERAARGINNPSRAPEGELFIDCFPAGADHLSQIVLRYWNGDVALFWSAMMVHQE